MSVFDWLRHNGFSRYDVVVVPPSGRYGLDSGGGVMGPIKKHRDLVRALTLREPTRWMPEAVGDNDIVYVSHGDKGNQA